MREATAVAVVRLTVEAVVSVLHLRRTTAVEAVSVALDAVVTRFVTAPPLLSTAAEVFSAPLEAVVWAL